LRDFFGVELRAVAACCVLLRRLVHQERITQSGGASDHHVHLSPRTPSLRDEGHRYDPALALTWQRPAIDLFQRKLGEGDLPARL
jgi:hypothetical protein